jgi:threonylcarbamoyladenosine tRNA methylthiotransferase MtaB
LAKKTSNEQRETSNDDNMSKLFKIITLGCKVNQYESAFIEGSLLRKGCKKARTGEEADLVIINSCIVTSTAGYQTRQAIRRGIRENPRAVAAVVGCYGQVFPEELADIEGLDLITGNRGKGSLPGLLLDTARQDRPLILRKDFDPSCPFEYLPIKSFAGRTRAFVKIQDGCESFCSYCIVPLARGPLRSLEPHKVVELLRELERNGHKEAVLTGIHLGKYGTDLGSGMNLHRLLVEIGRNRSQMRVRLSSLEPAEIGSDLIEFMESHDWVCRHFHISLQSGDDTVLRSMNRHYTAEKFTNLIEDIHRRVPRVSIGVDVLAGFPGETERAFDTTLALLRDLPLAYLHVFPYSKREGTEAAQLPDHLHPKTIKERTALLRNLDKEKRRLFWSSLVGETFQVLTEGWAPGQMGLARGLSDNYLRFAFPTRAPSINEFIRVRAVGINDQGLMGTAIEG